MPRLVSKFARIYVNTIAICNRICTVPCKQAVQVQNSSVPKFVPTRVNVALRDSVGGILAVEINVTWCTILCILQGYQVDSDSSDDDGDERQEKYFRMNIDGTTARFKLSKEEWERIPINTFPSGGRLLSGDWTRIFLSKVKESNPWCSLRFKNNHVRSENSRKMHSAVFFRGGAECKRPECNVKVRFVIQKERGKYVDVTYVGNVCHSSEPGGGDAVSDKRRVKRVRRTYSS